MNKKQSNKYIIIEKNRDYNDIATVLTGSELFALVNSASIGVDTAIFKIDKEFKIESKLNLVQVN